MSEFYTFGKQLREILRGLLQLDEGGGGHGLRPPDTPDASQFPQGGIDLIHHDLRIQVDLGATGEADETILMKGMMMIEREDPYVNEDGYRQIDFRVLSWTATGWSRRLRRDLTYVLSEDVEQPLSAIIAEQKDRDYPATFLFNVIFDARTGGQAVFRKHHGRPEGHGFREVPPTGNRRSSPTITQFEDQLIVLEDPNGGKMQFKPVDCNDQDSKTLHTFEEPRATQAST